MKKILGLFAVTALALSLSACGGNEKPSTTTTPSTDVNTDKPSNDKTSTKTEATDNNDDEEMLTYSVKVVLPNGEPYTEGVQIQLCADQCLLPSKTGADGTVKFDERHSHINPDEIYRVHVLPSETEFLAKYAYNINEYSVSSTNKEVTIQLFERQALGEAAGTKADPYKLVKAGAYNVSFAKKGFVFFDYKATKTGKVTLEGFGEQITALEKVNTSLVVLDEAGNKVSEIKAGGIGNNFKYEFDATANTNYRFALGTIDGSVFPAKLDFAITEA